MNSMLSENDFKHFLSPYVNMESTEPRVPFGNVEVITSKILQSPP